MPLDTKLTTIQIIRAGKVVRQTHQAVIHRLPVIERPTLNALQKAVEAAGGKFERNAIRVIKRRIDD